MSLPQQFENRNHALILGAGISGLAAASILCSKGYEATVFGGCSNEKEKASLISRGVIFSDLDMTTGVQALCSNVERAASLFAVLSPGISINFKAVELLKNAKIPIIGEMELGLALGEALLPFIAITGSKGKSSIVKLIADTLTAAGKPAIPCGNYGIPTCKIAEENKAVIPVVECSSFQLESITEQFSPHSAILLNVSPDHLDRHLTIENYRDTKLRIFANCNGRRLIPSQSPYKLLEAAANSGLDVSRFSTFGLADSNAEFYYTSGKIYVPSLNIHVDISGSYFDNPIIGIGAAAAVAVLMDYGLTVEQIESGFKNFTPLAHRMQRVRTVSDVTFINDSKATSLAALLAGCKMASTEKKPIFLIAGGRLKEKITLKANDLVDFSVKKVYIIGECLEIMASAWEKDIAIERCYTMDVAVNKAFTAAKEAHGIVLLSPGTASFDQFNSYNERGEYFTKLVKQL